MSFIYSCSDETPRPAAKEKPIIPQEEKSPEKTQEAKLPEFPIIYIEELDQSQEFFKEQHETSFSHVSRKNWMSFTAGKNGLLTKILLYGKPNYAVSEHYGLSMNGFIRAEDPNSGPKLGFWEISRTEIVNQLAQQGLSESDAGWITMRIRGEVPQESGKTYFLVCDKISENRAWFGAFAFGEGDPYPGGRHWLHPGHDLVFRTYVGKTRDFLDKEHVKHPTSTLKNSTIQSPESLELPKIQQRGTNLIQNSTENALPSKSDEDKPDDRVQNADEKERSNSDKNGSLFDRLFKNKKK